MTYAELQEALAWKPVVCGSAVTEAPPSVVLGGMGGSALPGNALRFLDGAFPLSVHRGYDLPVSVSPDALHVAISYSGNTAETLSFAHAAWAQGVPLAVIASGGALIDFAEEKRLPFVRVPAGMQPRNALWYQLHALCTLVSREDLRAALSNVVFSEGEVMAEAGALATGLSGTFPAFYAPRENGFLSWSAKILVNETAKMPAIANVFPELNHNEMQSFDTTAPEEIASLMHFVLLRHADDDSRIAKRMEVFSDLMRERSRTVTNLALVGDTRATLLVRSWFLFHHMALALAKARGVDPLAVPFVEAFKSRL